LEDDTVSRRSHLSTFAALVLIVPITASLGQAAEPKRGVYEVKNASVKSLADALGKRFKDAEVQIGPGAGNLLLIKAPPAVFDEVMKALDQLDKKPRSVAVEVFVVVLPPKKADDKEKPKEPDAKEFAGTIEDISAKLAEMKKNGDATAVARFTLSSVEGEAGTLMDGGSVPFVTRVFTTPRGVVSRVVSYRSVGTQVRVTPRVDTENTASLELEVRDLRMFQPASLPAIGKDEKGNLIPATDFLATALNAKMGVASGKAVLAKDAKVSSKSGEGRTLIIIGVRVIEPDKN
jgi:type II secretory pathway component GspD/PulD (secretin)